MPQIEETELSFLWRKNGNRPWIKYLLSLYHTEHGKDYETIRYWIGRFRQGESSTLVVDRNFTITDGHHRLIAGKISKLDLINVIVCPQKTTYGR